MNTRTLDVPILTLDGVSRDFGSCCALRGVSLADRNIALRCLEHVGLLDRAWQRTDIIRDLNDSAKKLAAQK